VVLEGFCRIAKLQQAVIFIKLNVENIPLYYLLGKPLAPYEKNPKNISHNSSNRYYIEANEITDFLLGKSATVCFIV